MKVLTALVLLFSFCCCNENNKRTVHFMPIAEDQFNFPVDSTFNVPHGKIWEEWKRIHDSCMGSSYAANAVFMRTRDTFPLGCIVDMKTMKIVARPPFFRDTANFFSSLFTFTTKPCYEKRLMRIPIDSFMNKKSLFRIDSTNNKINEELMVAVRNAPETEIETGSWITMELTSALGTLLDTTKDIRWLEYKRVLLTPGNMILIRSSSVTEINFYFHTQEPLTEELVKRLLSKPVSLQQSFFKSQFFYIDNNTFELTVNGFFQIVGQFMKSELQ